MENVHVTFIHGLANKPAPEQLRRIWLEALRTRVPGDDGFDLGAVGVSDSFIYWADLFYDKPLQASDYESISEELTGSLQHPKTPVPSDAWMEAIKKRYPEAVEDYTDPPFVPEAAAYERIPLPGFVKKAIMAEFLREAHDYLFNVNDIRNTIRARLMEDLRNQPKGSHRILVGHSQGTFMAYDLMTGVADCPLIDGFMTFGSPLGIDEVQECLTWSRNNGFPSRLAGDWVNVFDPFDPVARLDPHLANDFCRQGKPAIIDISEQNWGMWRHSASKYLQGPELRKQLRRLCGIEGA